MGNPSIDIAFTRTVLVGASVSSCTEFNGDPVDFGYLLGYGAPCSTAYCGKTQMYVNAPYTTFNIRSIANILQQQKYIDSHLADNNDNIDIGNAGQLQANTPMGIYYPNYHEFPDYSDIFIEVDYVKGQLADHYPSTPTVVVPSGDPDIYGPSYLSTRRYSFGGFIDAEKTNGAHNWISDYAGYNDANKWYMIYRGTNGDYEFVTLSSYIHPSSVYTSTDFIQYENTALNTLPTILDMKYFHRISDNGGPVPIIKKVPWDKTLLIILLLVLFAW
jgi:hypothetical protein